MSRRALATVVLAVAARRDGFRASRESGQATAADCPTRPTWVTNGDVHAVIHGGGRTYIGGTFDQVGPNTGFGVPLDAADAAPCPSRRRSTATSTPPCPTATAAGTSAATSPGWRRVKSRHNAAHIKADGTAGSWNPSPDYPVYAVALDADTNRVYIGGEFSTVRKSSATAAATPPCPAWRPPSATTVASTRPPPCR